MSLQVIVMCSGCWKGNALLVKVFSREHSDREVCVALARYREHNRITFRVHKNTSVESEDHCRLALWKLNCTHVGPSCCGQRGACFLEEEHEQERLPGMRIGRVGGSQPMKSLQVAFCQYKLRIFISYIESCLKW